MRFFLFMFWEGLVEIFDWLDGKFNWLLTPEATFFIMNGILLFFTIHYISDAKKHSKLKKIFNISSVFILWNAYFFTVMYFILN